MYEYFLLCTDQAMGARNKRRVETIQDIADEERDWRAHMALLKAEARDIYGDHVQTVDTTPAVTSASFDQSAIDALSDDEKRTLAEILEKIAGKGKESRQAAGFVQQLGSGEVKSE